MEKRFGHEKLRVYQKAMDFVVIRSAVLGSLPRKVAACDHLDRAAESILVNIAEGNGRFSGADQAKFLGIAFRATVQSASLVDLATINSNVDPVCIEAGRDSLRRIAAMLASLAKSASSNT